MRAIEEGIVPLNALPWENKMYREVNDPNEEGMVPFKALLYNNKFVRDVKDSMD
jgi:hypothetical protein